LPGGVILGWAKPVPFNIYNLRNRRLGEALIAIAGPLSNLLIAVGIGFFVRFSGIAFQNHTYLLLVSAIYTNIVLAVFNLIPLPPLDGSRIVYALFPVKTAEILHRIEKYGFIVTLMLVLVFIELIQPVIDFIFTLIVGKVI
jgi:Zn-dependent protease